MHASKQSEAPLKANAHHRLQLSSVNMPQSASMPSSIAADLR